MNINLEDQSICTDMIEKGDVLYCKGTKDAFLVVKYREGYNLVDLRSNTIQSDTAFMEKRIMLHSILGITSSTDFRHYELIKGNNLSLQKNK